MRKFLPFLLALALVAWLAVRSGTSVDEIVVSVRQVTWPALAGILLSTGAFLALSTLKWRMVMRRLSPDDEHHRGWGYGFYYTTLGALLALVVLPQAAMVIARGYGDKFRLGKSPVTTSAATLYEQLFDLVPILVFAVTALLAHLLDWSASTWLAATAGAGIASGALVILALQTRFWLLASLVPRPVRSRFAPRLEWFASPAAQELLKPRFVLAIHTISVVRYFVLLLRTYLIFAALSLSLSSYGFAQAYSIVSVSRLFFITPGGLGIAEWSWTGVLTWLAMPLQESVRFVLANRLFNWLSTLLIFVLAWVAFAFRAGKVEAAGQAGTIGG